MTPKLSVTVIVPDLSDKARSTGYGYKRRLRRGDRVVEIVQAAFANLLVQLRKDHP